MFPYAAHIGREYIGTGSPRLRRGLSSSEDKDGLTRVIMVVVEALVVLAWAFDLYIGLTTFNTIMKRLK